MQLKELGLAPIIRDIRGDNNELLDKLYRAWSKVAELADENWSVSPYGDSWYSSKDIDWHYKPEGSLRVSDHWNFTDRYGITHCETTGGQLSQGWAVGRYTDGKYEILEVF